MVDCREAPFAKDWLQGGLCSANAGPGAGLATSTEPTEPGATFAFRPSSLVGDFRHRPDVIGALMPNRTDIDVCRALWHSPRSFK